MFCMLLADLNERVAKCTTRRSRGRVLSTDFSTELTRLANDPVQKSRDETRASKNGWREYLRR
jgi:hypothetical protein